VPAVTQTLETLLPTLARLAAHRDERPSLAELADDAGTSASTFQRAFSRLVGESPKQYTRRLQLESAALALISTTRSVLDVALEVGFDSHEGFTRAFAAHFGVPPTEFRDQHAHLAGDAVNAALIHHLGPCIGLFRASLDPLPNVKDTTMNYDITRQPIPESTFLYKKARCSHADIAKTLARLLGGGFSHAIKSGVEMRSPPTTLYLEWGPGMVTMHAGLMVAAATPADDIFVETLPACEAAVTIHTGAYDGLGDAHAALEQFLAANDLDKAGPPREVYLTDPGEVPDPKQWKTQIVWPVRARK
jgi:AraC family transcriptional regulator